jgi:hypothetical protein
LFDVDDLADASEVRVALGGCVLEIGASKTVALALFVGGFDMVALDATLHNNVIRMLGDARNAIER